MADEFEVIHGEPVKYGRSITGFFPRKSDGIIRFFVPNVPRLTDAKRIAIMREAIVFAGHKDVLANATDAQLVGESKRRMSAADYLILKPFTQNGREAFDYFTDNSGGWNWADEVLIIHL